MRDRSDMSPPSKSPRLAGLTGEVYEVRWLDGRRFDCRRKATEHQARLLVEGGAFELQFNQTAEDSERWQAVLNLLFVAGTTKGGQD